MNTTTLIKIFGFTFILLLLGSCSKDAPEQQKEYVRNGNNVDVRIPANISSLNPATALDSYTLMVIRSIHQYLATYDLETAQMVPVLLKELASVDTTDGRTIYQMEIKEDANWDDGSPITAKDVETSLKMLFNPKGKPSPYRSYLATIDLFEIDPDNPKKFSVGISQQYVLAEEAIYSIMPVLQASKYDPDNQYAAYSLVDLINNTGIDEADEVLQALAATFESEAFSVEPAGVNGSGPYEVVEWKTGELMVLAKKTDWWGETDNPSNTWFKANPDTIRLISVTDATTAAQMFTNNSFDVAITLDSKDFKTLAENPTYTDEYNFISDVTNIQYLVYQNTKSPVLQDKRVRMGISMLFDYTSIIENIFDGLGNRTNSPVLNFKSYYAEDLPLIDFDIEGAIAQFNEAGWIDNNKDGVLEKEIDGVLTDFKLEYLVTPTPAAENIALIFQAAAKDAGVEVEIITKDRQGWYEMVGQRDFDLTMTGSGFSPGLDDFRQMFHTSANIPTGQNRMQFGNAETDALLDAIAANLDEISREEQFRTFQEILYDEQAVTWLMTPLSRVVIHDRFEHGGSNLSPNVCLGCLTLK